MTYKQDKFAITNMNIFITLTHRKNLNPFRWYSLNKNYRFETKIHAQRDNIIIYDF